MVRVMMVAALVLAVPVGIALGAMGNAAIDALVSARLDMEGK